MTEASCSRDGLCGLREQQTVVQPVNRTLESGVEKAWIFQWRLQSSNESLCCAKGSSPTRIKTLVLAEHFGSPAWRMLVKKIGSPATFAHRAPLALMSNPTSDRKTLPQDGEQGTLLLGLCCPSLRCGSWPSSLQPPQTTSGQESAFNLLRSKCLTRSSRRTLPIDCAFTDDFPGHG
jgi:hypothetical protein